MSVGRALPLHGIMIGNRFDFTTQGTQNFKFESNAPIQSARFIKPVEKVISPSDVPAFVDCDIALYTGYVIKY